MPKYSKGIKIFRFNILVSNKNSFQECDKEIMEELGRHPEIDEKIKKEFIKEVLS